jgi:hypothetical protein
MKLRVSDNTVRVRISQSELAELKAFIPVRLKVDFPVKAQLSCQLIPSKVDTLGCTFSSSTISIFIPESTIATWNSSTFVKLERTLDLENGKELFILVEKDFKRLSNREKEDESDLFTNPRKK